MSVLTLEASRRVVCKGQLVMCKLSSRIGDLRKGKYEKVTILSDKCWVVEKRRANNKAKADDGNAGDFIRCSWQKTR